MSPVRVGAGAPGSQGDPSKAKAKLGWQATTTCKALVKIMIESDVKMLEDQLAGRGVRVGERHG